MNHADSSGTFPESPVTRPDLAKLKEPSPLRHTTQHARETADMAREVLELLKRRGSERPPK